MKDINNNNTNDRTNNTQFKTNDNKNNLVTQDSNHKLFNIPVEYKAVKYSGMAISIFLFIIVSTIVFQKLSSVVFIAFDILVGLSLVLFSIGLGIATILFLISRNTRNNKTGGYSNTTVIKNNVMGSNSIIIATNGEACTRTDEANSKTKKNRQDKIK